MTEDTIWLVLAVGLAAGGLYFSGYQLKMSNRTKQLEILESNFKDIRNLELLLYERYQDAGKEKLSQWNSLFFNQLEWIAFLINTRKLTDASLIEFFKPAIKSWYENIFLRHFTKEVIENEQEFYELKKLYRIINKEFTRT